MRMVLRLFFLFSLKICVAADHAIVSFYAVDCSTGKVLLEQNSHYSLIPSSCMKIPTTAAALELLGADCRFQTHLEYDGRLDQEKTLHGNLYIRGGGDPCLGSDRTSGSWEKQIALWADAIEELGIKKIEGNLIGDGTKWEKALAVPSWSWEDLGNYYGAGACALTFHENGYTLFFQPGKSVGDPTKIVRTDPPLLPIDFVNEVKTGPIGSGDRACIYGSEFARAQYVRGTVPAQVEEFSIKGAIPDPPLYCAQVLAHALQKRGIVIEGNEIPQKERTQFHTTHSPAASEIVYHANQKSVNLYAEHLLKAVGEKVYGFGSTDSGIKAIADFWSRQNLDLEGFHMVDGSGLSRKNLVTAKQLVEMLTEIKKKSYFPIFLNSLPHKGCARAKSGSMSLVRSYAGYAGDIAFAIIINQCPDRQVVNQKIEAFFSELEECLKNPS